MNHELINSSKNKNLNASNSWQAGDGWLGIIPGSTKLDEVITKFGKPDDRELLLNATSYQFLSGTIQVIVLKGDADNTVATVRILPGCPIKNSIPSNMGEATIIFADLEQTEAEHSRSVIFEQPGLSVACELFGNPPQIKWLEFYPYEPSKG